MPGTAASCFNISTATSETGKKGDCYTLLKRITIAKSVNSAFVSKRPAIYLDRYSLEGLMPP